MNAKQLVKAVNKNYLADMNYKMAEDGSRIRVTQECKDLGSDVVELGRMFFYSATVGDNLLNNVGSTVQAYFPEPVTMEAISSVRFDMRPWPKESLGDATGSHQLVTNFRFPIDS